MYVYKGNNASVVLHNKILFIETKKRAIYIVLLNTFHQSLEIAKLSFNTIVRIVSLVLLV